MRTIFITGTSKGIGFQSAIELLDKGHKVIGASRSKQSIKHKNFYPLKLDLSKADQIKPAIKSIVEEHPDISALLLNAGVGLFGYLEQLNEKQLYDSMQINFISHALICKYFIQHLKGKKHSDIIFIGSEAALNGAKAGSFYCASKFALRGFATSLKQECSKNGVRISMIHPGMVKTSFHDQCYFKPGDAKENVILPKDVAQVVISILESNPNISFDEISLSPLKKVLTFR